VEDPKLTFWRKLGIARSQVVVNPGPGLKTRKIRRGAHKQQDRGSLLLGASSFKLTESCFSSRVLQIWSTRETTRRQIMPLSIGST